ncbi:MAG: GNAT family N-acetyltransferase [Actinomycetota bacterium]|nr:GNAT family N-acetyltransferase [Actinomycetota bacterium]
MSDIEVINPVPIEEVRPWLAALATTFLDNTEGDDFDRMVEFWRRDWFADRSWGARAGGRWVATLATEPRSISIPGPAGRPVDVVADALTAVTVSATHRRRGLLTQMLSASLRAAKHRGDPLSILLAAEWPIYGRYGYSPATLTSNYTLFTRTRDSLLTPTGTGSVRQVDPADLADIAPAVFEASRSLRAGGVDRPGEWWKRRLGLEGYQPINHGKTPNYIVHESDGVADGLLRWAGSRDFELTGEMGAVNVADLITATPAAYRNLWAYLAGLDVVGEVIVARRPVDEPIRWLLADGRALRQTFTGDDVWVRLLDVPAALSARGYSAGGRVVMDVVDDDTGGYAAGRFLLEADHDGAHCQLTTAAADLRISHRALASIYLGGFTLRQLVISGNVDELTPGSLSRTDAMFATTLPPWNATGF